MKVHSRVTGQASKPAIPFYSTLGTDHIERLERKKRPVAMAT